jgi:hypothetical protein
VKRKPNTKYSNMKKYFVTIIVAAAAVVSLVVIGKKAQAQNSRPQTKDNSGAKMVNPLANTEPTPKDAIFVTEIPAGYRDWKVVSVAHEAGDLNDIRAVLGNDIAIKAYREGKLPFPEGAIVGRIAWSYVPSEENNKTFGKEQSFVAGLPTPFYLQFMEKDSKKYAATGGWGYSSFDNNGKPTSTASMQSCYPCHQLIKSRDFIFSKYAP